MCEISCVQPHMDSLTPFSCLMRTSEYQQQRKQLVLWLPGRSGGCTCLLIRMIATCERLSSNSPGTRAGKPLEVKVKKEEGVEVKNEEPQSAAQLAPDAVMREEAVKVAVQQLHMGADAAKAGAKKQVIDSSPTSDTSVVVAHCSGERLVAVVICAAFLAQLQCH